MPVTAAVSSHLPATGVDVLWVVLGAVAVVVIGVGAFVLSRRGGK